MDATKLGKFIAECRREQQMTQGELAEKLHVTDKAVSRWERGKGFPDIQTIEPLAEALEVSVLELMRSEKINMEEKKNGWSEKEVTEVMEHTADLMQENRKQDKNVTLIAGTVTIGVAVVIKLLGYANLLGSIFIGAFAALAISGLYLFSVNQEKRIDRKIYGFCLLIGTGLLMAVLTVAHVSGYTIAWINYVLLCWTLGAINKGK